MLQVMRLTPVACQHRLPNKEGRRNSANLASSMSFHQPSFSFGSSTSWHPQGGICGQQAGLTTEYSEMSASLPGSTIVSNMMGDTHPWAEFTAANKFNDLCSALSGDHAFKEALDRYFAAHNSSTSIRIFLQAHPSSAPIWWNPGFEEMAGKLPQTEYASVHPATQIIMVDLVSLHTHTLVDGRKVPYKVKGAGSTPVANLVWMDWYRSWS